MIRAPLSVSKDVGDLPKVQVKLWMQADSARLADLEIAKKIFRTVEFLKP